MIQVENIQIKKGGKTLLHDVTCKIHPGEVVVLIGKNGAGKSTLMEALSGENKPSSGRILWDGEDLNSMRLDVLSRRRAVLSQMTDISFPISVYELVEMGTYVIAEKLRREEIRERVLQALDQMGMLDYVNRSFNTLSGGEQQRVMLAKCVVQLNATEDNKNKYLFLDEPTAGLDINRQYTFIQLIKSMAHNEGVGVFAVLHDINLASICADKLIMLRDGRIIAEGTPQDVLNPEMIKNTLDVKAIVGKHPVIGCPFVTAVPQSIRTEIPVAKI